MTSELNISPITDWLSGHSWPFHVFGPCSAETREQTLTTARQVAEIFPNAIYRAGVWKPRSRPNNFDGAGAPALEWLSEVKKETGMSVATEVANAQHVEACLKNDIDILWVGARTTVNPFSVQEIADALRGVDIPVFIKNPVVPDLQLWVGALERINQAGITKLAAIHRGFHFYESIPYRNMPYWQLPLDLMRMFPDLPIICDVSHISGKPELIPSIAQKAMDLNMQGLMVETHVCPAEAWSDAQQQVTPAQLRDIIANIALRQPSIDNPDFSQRIQELRAKIDEIDSELLQKFGQRMAYARSIGEYKKENAVTIFQVRRWDEVLQRCLTEGKKLGLSETFVKALLLEIHDESIRQQDRVMNNDDKGTR